MPLREERLEISDTAAGLADRVAGSFHERAVSFYLVTMLVPRCPHVGDQVRPPLDQPLVLGLGPVDRQCRRGVPVGVVGSKGPPTRVVHRRRGHDSREPVPVAGDPAVACLAVLVPVPSGRWLNQQRRRPRCRSRCGRWSKRSRRSPMSSAQNISTTSTPSCADGSRPSWLGNAPRRWRVAIA